MPHSLYFLSLTLDEQDWRTGQAGLNASFVEGLYSARDGGAGSLAPMPVPRRR